MFERILVALDGSDRSQEVLTPAAELARKFAAQLILLQAVTPFTEALGAVAAVTTPIIGPSTADVGAMVSEPIAGQARQQHAIASSALEYLRGGATTWVSSRCAPMGGAAFGVSPSAAWRMRWSDMRRC